MVFGPAQIINMALLPLYARPPFMNVIGLGWTSEVDRLKWLDQPAKR
jgi:hypothetical protein